MNILRVLASGDGTINEPNISALLGYLLDPSEDHGISDHLLNSILSDFDVNLTRIIARDELECSVDLEVTLDFGDEDEKDKKRTRKRRDLDVLVSFYQKGEKDPKYVLGIENKINDGALQPDQLKDEWSLLKQHYRESTIYFCFLTPPTKRSNNEFEEFVKSDPAITSSVKHLYWKRPGKEDFSSSTGRIPSQSLFEKLCDILEKERRGEIDPIPVESVCFIKSLLSFIRTDFQTETKQDNNERRDYGKPAWEFYKEAIEKLEFDKDIEYKKLLEEGRNLIRKLPNGKEYGNNGSQGRPSLNNLIVNCEFRDRATFDNHDKYDLLFFPDPNNRKIVRRYDKGNPPPGVRIYCKQDGQKGFIDTATGVFQPD